MNTRLPPRRFVDLSLPLETGCSEPVPVEIERIDHQRGGDLLGEPANLSHRDFPDQAGLSLEIVRAATHAGTHVDAPSHYGPSCEGKPARTIDQLPLEWFFGRGVVVDCREGAPEEDISESELAERFEAMRYRIQPRDIVLIQTGADKLWGRPEYFTHFRGMGRAATEWLLDQGVRVIGIDTFGFDAPFRVMLDRFHDSGSTEALWPAHMVGREREYCQIERLANLDQLPSGGGFDVACFPIRIRDCGAAWSRVVAFLP